MIFSTRANPPQPHFLQILLLSFLKVPVMSILFMLYNLVAKQILKNIMLRTVGMNHSSLENTILHVEKPLEETPHPIFRQILEGESQDTMFKRRRRFKRNPLPGFFVTRGGHSCTYGPAKVIDHATGMLEVRVNCRYERTKTYMCVFQGNPKRCRAYVADQSIYWRQVQDLLAKKHHACAGKPLLDVSICKSESKDSLLKQIYASEKPPPMQQKEKPKDKKKPKGMKKSKEYCGKMWNRFCNFFVNLWHN
uniref:Uncharacterized protein n=1 Tax=Eptatretus burgeri TaxID=7764 RepID=A0A8C4QRS5_EPTBU